MERHLKHFCYVMGENPVTVFAFSLFSLIVFLALFGPWITPYDPLATNAANALQPPSWRHVFGTDQLGRDDALLAVQGPGLLLRVLPESRLESAPKRVRRV